MHHMRSRLPRSRDTGTAPLGDGAPGAQDIVISTTAAAPDSACVLITISPNAVLYHPGRSDISRSTAASETLKAYTTSERAARPLLANDAARASHHQAIAQAASRTMKKCGVSQACTNAGCAKPCVQSDPEAQG